MRYAIIRKFRIEELIMDVTELLNVGWEPLGQPFQFQDLICQAMVKKHEREPEQK